MLVSEIFCSIQGEGQWLGIPSIFIRTAGCNLDCIWCDTRYANQGTHSSLESILSYVASKSIQHVVITGGEPTIAPDIAELTQKIHKMHKYITLETNGTCYVPNICCDLLSISPKLSNSNKSCHTNERIHINVLKSWLSHTYNEQDRATSVSQKLTPDIQLKFVVSCPEDIQEISEILSQLPYVSPDKILLMPCGTTVEDIQKHTNWLLPICLDHGYRYCTRLHIYLFGGKRGT